MPIWFFVFLCSSAADNAAGVQAFRAREFGRAQALFLAAFHQETEPVSRARIASNLAAAARRLGDLAAAEKFTRVTLELRHAALGETHPETVIALHNLGDVIAARGRPREALAWLERARALVRLPDDRRTILAGLEQVRRDLALRSLGRGRLDEALAHCASDACRAWVRSLVR